MFIGGEAISSGSQTSECMPVTWPPVRNADFESYTSWELFNLSPYFIDAEIIGAGQQRGQALCPRTPVGPQNWEW